MITSLYMYLETTTAFGNYKAKSLESLLLWLLNSYVVSYTRKHVSELRSFSIHKGLSLHRMVSFPCHPRWQNSNF